MKQRANARHAKNQNEVRGFLRSDAWRLWLEALVDGGERGFRDLSWGCSGDEHALKDVAGGLWPVVLRTNCNCDNTASA